MTTAGVLKPTDRQLEVLRVVIEEGGSRKRAAHRLHLSPFTVREHLAQLYAKVGARNVIQAAYLLGWLSLPTEGPARDYSRGRPPRAGR